MHDNRQVIYVFVMLLSLFHLGDVYGLPGRPVMLQCGDAIEHNREELEWWRSGYPGNLLLARGVYVYGVLTDASYHTSLTGRNAELSPDGGLTIHSYTDRDAGDYWCDSEYRQAWTYLPTFSMYIR